MLDDAYLCEVNLYLAEKALKELNNEFDGEGLIDLDELAYLSGAKSHYSIVVFCHGGY